MSQKAPSSSLSSCTSWFKGVPSLPGRQTHLDDLDHFRTFLCTSVSTSTFLPLPFLARDAPLDLEIAARDPPGGGGFGKGAVSTTKPPWRRMSSRAPVP